MKSLLLMVVLLAGVGSAYGHEAKAVRTAPAASAITAEQATSAVHRWHADAPLQAGMARVRTASDALEHLQHGHLDARQVRALADEITAAVNDMFANCKLDPAPDAALHPLLARLLAASQALRDDPTDAKPLGDVRAVLARYAELFEQSGSSPSGR